jgi:hypothetical protein
VLAPLAPRRRDATLDEASVSNADQRAAEWRRPVPRGPRISTPITTITVHPEVWAEAMRLADGNASHIQVHSEFNVTVHNRPWRTNKKAGNR